MHSLKKHQGLKIKYQYCKDTKIIPHFNILNIKIINQNNNRPAK